MASIETVLFDMDGVVSRYDFTRRLAVLATATGVPPAEIEKRIFDSGFDARADDGAYTAEEYMAEFSRLLGVPVYPESWLEARRAGMTPDLDVLALVREVSARAAIALLTNNGPVLRTHLAEVAPEIAATFGSRAFFSCQFGTGKTSPSVFALVLAEIGAQPGTTLFVDDSAEYTHNAAAAGLRVHHFRGIDALRVELRELGLM
jgi:glucose-1-phosphatase